MEAGVYDERFLIKLTLGADIIPNDGNQTDLLNVWSLNGKLMADIQISPGSKGTVFINSITGQPVYTKDIYDSGRHVFEPQLKTGIYIFSLVSESTKKSRKVFILSK
jgi:hypothetical protein